MHATKLFLTLGIAGGAVLVAAAAPAPEKATADKPATVRTETPASYPTEFRTAAGVVVKRGMTTEDVQKLLGAPTEKRTLKTETAGDAEVWTYRDERTTAAPKSLHSDKIVTQDNGEGFVVQHDVPVYRIENRTLVEIRELLFFRGRLLNWKEVRGEKRAMQ